MVMKQLFEVPFQNIPMGMLVKQLYEVPPKIFFKKCLHSSPLNFKWLVWTFLINKCFFLLNEKQMAFLQNDSPCHFRCWAWQKDWEFLINKWLFYVFSRMSSHMMLQMLSLRNELWMTPHMIPQMSSYRKRHWTFPTNKLLFSTMSPHMIFQVSRFRKWLWTFLKNMVYRQSWTY